jgi:hypothetical protein
MLFNLLHFCLLISIVYLGLVNYQDFYLFFALFP